MTIDKRIKAIVVLVVGVITFILYTVIQGVVVKKLSLIILLLSLIIGCGIYFLIRVTAQDISSESFSFNQETLNLENSPLYREIIEDDRIFESTYIPQPDMFAQRKAVIATCMDHRLNEFLGSVTKGTYIIRNAGGRVTEDWIRSIVVLYKLLEVEEIFLIQHTDCGMQKFTDEIMKNLLEGSTDKAELIKNCNLSLEVLEDNHSCSWKNTNACGGKTPCVDYKCIDWLTIQKGLYESVLEDVKKIRNHPLIPSNIPIYGFIFDVLTGHLTPVPEAMKAGKAKPLSCNP